MSGLEYVTLVNQFRRHGRVLPQPLSASRYVRGRAPRPSNQVRIAYGYGNYVLQRWFERPQVARAMPSLDVTGVLEELATGAYDYIEQLVLEVSQCVDVDIGDVERLRAHVRTVEVRVVDSTPTLILLEYCVEPAAFSSDEP